MKLIRSYLPPRKLLPWILLCTSILRLSILLHSDISWCILSCGKHRLISPRWPYRHTGGSSPLQIFTASATARMIRTPSPMEVWFLYLRIRCVGHMGTTRHNQPNHQEAEWVWIRCSTDDWQSWGSSWQCGVTLTSSRWCSFSNLANPSNELPQAVLLHTAMGSSKI